MSPTKLPAESSKDVQALAPPEEKGPSPVDEGEKGVLDKTPKEDMQYRVKGNKHDADSDADTIASAVDWKTKRRKRKRELKERKRLAKELSFEAESGAPRQGPSGLTQMASELLVAESSATRRPKADNVPLWLKNTFGAPTPLTGDDELFDGYPFKVYLSAAKLLNEGRDNEARALFPTASPAPTAGDVPMGCLIFWGFPHGKKWYSIQLPATPWTKGFEPDAAKNRRAIVAIVLLARIRWAKRDLKCISVQVRGWADVTKTPGPAVVITYGPKRPVLPPSTRLIFARLDNLFETLKGAKFINY